MNVIVVDDERNAREHMCRLLSSIDCIDDIQSFDDAEPALSWLSEHKTDVAFLDIELYGVSGLEIARRLKLIQPKTNVVFVSGYSQYMADAFSLHASGYMTKPPTLERLKYELNELRRPTPPAVNGRLQLRCFGSFEAFMDGRPVTFSRSKAKEALAYLTHKCGSVCTTRELAAMLFEDQPYDARQRNYMQGIIFSMMSSLKSVGAENAVIKHYNSLAIDPAAVDCDLYRFRQMDAQAVNSFNGEYMLQYSWAEFTVNTLRSPR